jgi:hypothetical protein
VNINTLARKNLFVYMCLLPSAVSKNHQRVMPREKALTYSESSVYSIRSSGLHLRALQKAFSASPSIRGILSVRLRRETLSEVFPIKIPRSPFVMRLRAISSFNRHRIKSFTAQTYGLSLPVYHHPKKDRLQMLFFQSLTPIFGSAVEVNYLFERLTSNHIHRRSVVVGRGEHPSESPLQGSYFS